MSWPTEQKQKNGRRASQEKGRTGGYFDRRKRGGELPWFSRKQEALLLFSKP
jgi:hypothetical protein